jgi:hypothetical protein
VRKTTMLRRLIGPFGKPPLVERDRLLGTTQRRLGPDQLMPALLHGRAELNRALIAAHGRLDRAAAMAFLQVAEVVQERRVVRRLRERGLVAPLGLLVRALVAGGLVSIEKLSRIHRTPPSPRARLPDDTRPSSGWPLCLVRAAKGARSV